MIFSVVIPALNEEKCIGMCLDALSRQTLAPDTFEVILVDNGSVDRTLEIAFTFQSSLQLTVLRKPACNISAARNAAAALAKGTFLAFLDADCVAPSCWLERALEYLRLGDGGVVGAFYSIPADSSWLAKAWYGELATSKRGLVTYVPAGTMFVARSVFSSLGGFDSTIETSEDFEFCKRVRSAGYDVLAYPVLSTVHLGTPQTMESFYQKQRWHGNGVRTVFEKNMFDHGFLKTIIQTVYFSFWLVMSIVALLLTAISGKISILFIPPGFLLLGSLILALHGAKQRKQWSLVAPLTLLYAVYGVARGLSLIGPRGQRAERTAAAAVLSTRNS